MKKVRTGKEGAGDVKDTLIVEEIVTGGLVDSGYLCPAVVGGNVVGENVAEWLVENKFCDMNIRR